MSHPKEADIAELIIALVDARVELIVVGGAAAVIHGVPITTEDLDIVHRRTPENVDRLLALLERLDAYHRYGLADRRLKPTRAMLLGTGQLNLCYSRTNRSHRLRLPGTYWACPAFRSQPSTALADGIA